MLYSKRRLLVCGLQPSIISSFLIIVLLLFPPFSALAQQINGAGSTSTNFQKIGMGARAAGMGESFTAVADDSTAMFWNPAGLVLARGTQLSQTHADWLIGVSSEAFSFSQNIKPDGAFGGSVIYLGSGTFPGALETSTGNYGGSGFMIDASDYSASLAYAQRLGHFIPDDFFKKSMVGIKVTLVGQNVVNLGNSGFSFDAGYIYEAIRKIFYLGAVVYNVGTNIQNYSQPLIFKLGGSYRFQNLWIKKDRLIVAAETDGDIDTGFKLDVGGEYKMTFGNNGVALRTGYRLGGDLGAVAGLTSGVGVSHRFEDFEFGLDYAFVPYGILGNTNRISWNIILGGDEVLPTASVKAPPSFTLKDETLKVNLSVKSEEPVEHWKMTLLDPLGKLVKTLEGKGNPPANFVWDGRDQAGTLVPQGNYTINLELVDEDEQPAKSIPAAVYARWVPKKVPYQYSFQVAGDLLFDSGKDELLATGYNSIQKAAETLQKRFPESVIIVAGHTDNVPLNKGAKFADNQQLSAARATAVMNYLIQSGMSPQRLSAIGYGDTRPIAPNDTPEGRAKNRRVELIVSGVKDASAQDMINDGLPYLKERNYRGALDLFLKALESDSRNSLAYRYAGDCYLNLGARSQALFAYRKALEYNPGDLGLKGWLEKNGGVAPNSPVTAVQTPEPLQTPGPGNGGGSQPTPVPTATSNNPASPNPAPVK